MELKPKAVYMAMNATDLRKGIDGYAQMIQSLLPYSKNLPASLKKARWADYVIARRPLLLYPYSSYCLLYVHKKSAGRESYHLCTCRCF